MFGLAGTGKPATGRRCFGNLPLPLVGPFPLNSPALLCAPEGQGLWPIALTAVLALILTWWRRCPARGGTQ